MPQVLEQKKVQSVLRDGGTQEDASALLKATGPTRDRRGSAALVAMRRRTLSEEAPPAGEGTRRKSGLASAVHGGRRGTRAAKPGQDKQETPPASPLSLNSEESRLMNRANRRRSIATLAAKAGLWGEFEKLGKRRASMQTTVEVLGSPSPNSGRRRLKKELLQGKQDSFYNLLVVPKKPEGKKNRKGSLDGGVGSRRRRSTSEPRSVRKTIAAVTTGVRKLANEVMKSAGP